MIRKLRIKLIIASMVSLLAVLLVIMSAVNIVYYRQVMQDADNTLALLAENNGFFPKTNREPPPDEPFPKKELHLSPELPYETRYFFVTLSPDGSVQSVNTGKIAAVDTSDAIDYPKHSSCFSIAAVVWIISKRCFLPASACPLSARCWFCCC